jgi:L-amino acid N-acyltransferase YncA
MIRQAEDRDAAGVLAIYEPIVRGTPISFETQPPTEAEMAERIARSYEWLIAERDRHIIGYAYAGPFHHRAAYRWSVEISIYLAQDARGSGLGRKLLSELLDALSQRGFVNAFAGISLPNPVSIRLFESFGFEKVAHQRNVGFKLDRWHDVGWWQRQLRAPTNPPPDISPRAPVVRG